MILVHVVASLLAAGLGLAVIGMRKGSPAHRIAGLMYAASIYLVSLSGFFIQEVTGSLSIFHWFSIQAIVLVTAGLAIPRLLRRRVRHWPIWHLRFMFYSFITLVITGVAQFFDHLPLPSDAANAIAFLSTPALVGVLSIERFGVSRWRQMVTPEERKRLSQS